jgi:integrase
MRGPAQNRVRLHAPVDQVRAVLDHAHELLLASQAADLERPSHAAVVHRAEQVYLLARLAADTGARRGELAALQFADLDGEVLTIARGTSCEVVGPTKSGPTKSGRIRRITLGASTATLWRDTVHSWRHNGATRGRFGPWLFSPTTDHTTRLTTACLGHWFTALTADAGYPDITLHRLRHTVATTLVSRGDILAAQYRLGHRGASTTLRIYSHALPLTDTDAAATLDQLYRP